MQVELRFYATLRDAVGEKAVTREFEDGTTVGEALDAVAGEFEGLESLLFDGDGHLRSHVTVALDGDPILQDRSEVTLSDGDTLVLSPGVSGGTRRASTPGTARPIDPAGAGR